jgi:L-Ala-D/L-Glu epimerase
MKVERIEIIRVDVPRERPFEIAGGTFHSADHTIVKVTLDSGAVGYGESSPLPVFSTETGGSVWDTQTRLLAPRLLGTSVVSMAGVHKAMNSVAIGHPVAKAGIDIAIHDAIGHALGVPVSALIGGAHRERIPLADSVGETDEAAFRQRTQQIIERGYLVVKLKGGRDPALDLDRIKLIRKEFGDAVKIRLDLNAGYLTAAGSAAVLRSASRLGVDEIEQPVAADDLRGMRHLTEELDAIVIADESVFTARDVWSCLVAGACDVVNVKTQKAGGLYPARLAMAVAEAAGAGVLVGAMQETGLGTAASLHLAATAIELTCASDTRTHTVLANTLIGDGLKIERGYGLVPEGPGLGVEVDEAAVKHYEIDRWDSSTHSSTR